MDLFACYSVGFSGPSRGRRAVLFAQILAAVCCVCMLASCGMMPASQVSDIYDIKLTVGDLRASQKESATRMQDMIGEIDKKLVEQDKFLQSFKEDLETQLATIQAQLAKAAVTTSTLVPTGPVVPAAAVGSLPSVPSPSEDEQKQYDAAEAEIQQKNYDGAIEKFTKFVADFPNSSKAAEAVYEIGKSYWEKGDLEKARQAFDRIATQYPTSSIIPQSLHARALCEYKLSQFAAARGTLEKLKAAYPDYESKRVEEMLKSLP